MTSPPPVMPDEDYEAIEAAVMDTARGRWFLAEFARRNRSADTSVLLAAIERLEKTMGGAPASQPAQAALPPPESDPKPHAPVSTGIATSASAELFAIERHAEPSHIPTSGLPDDGLSTWIIEDRSPSAPVPAQTEIVELDDVGLIWPYSEYADEDEAEAARSSVPVAPIAASTPPAAASPPALASVPPRAAQPEPAAPAPTTQNKMLSAALAAAQETVARASDAPPPLPPGSHSPQSVDPATLDGLSFEEKTVYFG